MESDSDQPIIEGNLNNRFQLIGADMDGSIVAFLKYRRTSMTASSNNPSPRDRVEYEVQLINTLTGQTLWTRPLSTKATDVKIDQGTVYVALADGRVEVFSPPPPTNTPDLNPNPGTPGTSTPANRITCSTALIISGVLLLMVAGYYAYHYGNRRAFSTAA